MQNLAASNSGKDAGATSPTSTNPQNEEMYHYAKLVEIKQKELKTIEKDEPLLYQQFSMDVNKLDSAYHGLQKSIDRKTRTVNKYSKPCYRIYSCRWDY